MQCLPGGETEPQTHVKAHFTSRLSLACVPGLCVFRMAPLSEGPPFLSKSHDPPSTVLTQLPVRAHCCCLLGPHRSTRTFIIHFPILATWYARLSPDAVSYLGESNIGGHSGQVRKSQKAWGSLLGPFTLSLNLSIHRIRILIPRAAATGKRHLQSPTQIILRMELG